MRSGEYLRITTLDELDPGDVDGLRAAIMRLLRDEPLRRELGQRGIERAKQYRWERSARLMTELLAEASRG